MKRPPASVFRPWRGCRYPLPFGVSAGQPGSGTGSGNATWGTAATFAATAQDSSWSPGPTLAALAAAWVIWYALSCWWFPFRNCGKCKGGGRIYREDSKVFRPCPRCKASGRRLRVGRWLWNWLHKRKTNGTRRGAK